MGRIDTTCPECGAETRPSPIGGRRHCLDCNKTFRARTREATPEQRRVIRDNLSRSRSQETRNARELGGRRTLASGATKIEKSDVVTSTYGRPPDGVRLECKSTNKESRSVRLSELRKIAHEAKGDEIPVLSIEFVLPGRAPEEFYIIPKHWAQALIEEYRDRDSDD